MHSHTKYSPRTDVDWNEVKQDTLKYCCGVYGEDVQVTESQIIDVNMQVWTALKNVDFNLNIFFSKKAYQNIQDIELIQDYIVWVCLPLVKPLSAFYTDWINGYLDFTSIHSDIAADAEWNPVEEVEVLEYLYYCQEDEDLWWLLGQGIGDIKTLFKWYLRINPAPLISEYTKIPCFFGRDKHDALMMIEYLENNLAVNNKALADLIRNLNFKTTLI